MNLKHLSGIIFTCILVGCSVATSKIAKVVVEEPKTVEKSVIVEVILPIQYDSVDALLLKNQIKDLSFSAHLEEEVGGGIVEGDSTLSLPVSRVPPFINKSMLTAKYQVSFVLPRDKQDLSAYKLKIDLGLSGGINYKISRNISNNNLAFSVECYFPLPVKFEYLGASCGGELGVKVNDSTDFYENNADGLVFIDWYNYKEDLGFSFSGHSQIKGKKAGLSQKTLGAIKSLASLPIVCDVPYGNKNVFSIKAKIPELLQNLFSRNPKPIIEHVEIVNKKNGRVHPVNKYGRNGSNRHLYDLVECSSIIPTEEEPKDLLIKIRGSYSSEIQFNKEIPFSLINNEVVDFDAPLPLRFCNRSEVLTELGSLQFNGRQVGDPESSKGVVFVDTVGQPFPYVFKLDGNSGFESKSGVVDSLEAYAISSFQDLPFVVDFHFESLVSVKPKFVHLDSSSTTGDMLLHLYVKTDAVEDLYDTPVRFGVNKLEVNRSDYLGGGIINCNVTAGYGYFSTVSSLRFNECSQFPDQISLELQHFTNLLTPSAFEYFNDLGKLSGPKNIVSDLLIGSFQNKPVSEIVSSGVQPDWLHLGNGSVDVGGAGLSFSANLPFSFNLYGKTTKLVAKEILVDKVLPFVFKFHPLFDAVSDLPEVSVSVNYSVSDRSFENSAPQDQELQITFDRTLPLNWAAGEITDSMFLKRSRVTLNGRPSSFNVE